MTWQNRAACRLDPAAADAFYPNKGGSTRAAKAVCAGCPVAAECLDYALANNEHFGIWGGLSERERRRLKRQRILRRLADDRPGTADRRGPAQASA